MTTEVTPDLDILRRWAEALESGRFKQGTKVLRAWSAINGENRFCCLGVLTVLAEEAGIEPDGPGACEFDEDGPEHQHTLWCTAEDELLPVTVMRWAGLDETNPTLIDATEPCEPMDWAGRCEHGFSHEEQYAAELNDEGKTFLEIAGYIRERWDLGPRQEVVGDQLA